LASGVAAKVAGEEITQTQLDEVIAQAESRLKAQGQKIPPAGSQEYQAFRQNALQFLVQRVQFEQKAKELGVSVSDDEVDERVKRVLTQFFGGSQKKYESSLEKQGITDEQVREELRATLVSEKIFAKVGNAAKVTDAEIRAYYASNPQFHSQKPSRDVRHILVSSKALADDLYGRLKNGADFAALVKKYSTDPGSSKIGGKLTIQRGGTVPEFDKAAFALKVGQLSQPVKTQFGWHIIQAEKPAKPHQSTPFKQVKESIRQQLLQQKRNDSLQKWLAELKKEYASKVAYATGLAPPATTTSSTPTG
jgi:parvulin-like peptidyl-prolyl isomerase